MRALYVADIGHHVEFHDYELVAFIQPTACGASVRYETAKLVPPHTAIYREREAAEAELERWNETLIGKKE